MKPHWRTMDRELAPLKNIAPANQSSEVTRTTAIVTQMALRCLLSRRWFKKTPNVLNQRRAAALRLQKHSGSRLVRCIEVLGRIRHLVL
jgi:hypothetical protein